MTSYKFEKIFITKLVNGKMKKDWRFITRTIFITILGESWECISCGFPEEDKEFDIDHLAFIVSPWLTQDLNPP